MFVTVIVISMVIGFTFGVLLADKRTDSNLRHSVKYGIRFSHWDALYEIKIDRDFREKR